MQGKVELAEALDTTGAYEESGGGENGGRELSEKRQGTNASLYPSRGSGWQMKPTQTPYRRRPAVREITGPLNRMT